MSRRRIDLDNELSEFDREYLLKGYCDFDGDSDGVDLESLPGKWEKHRGELMVSCEPFTRPFGWWQYENRAGELRLLEAARPKTVEEIKASVCGYSGPKMTAPVYETERNFLIRNEILTEEEIELLKGGEVPQCQG